jgi:hypothetical protein
MDREAKFSLPDKWLMLPLVVPAQGDPSSFQVDRYPWSHFAELVKLRNDFVHPKHNRRGYLRQLTPSTMEPLNASDVPPDSAIEEKELAYPQTRVPRDPHAVRLQHVEIVKKVVDDIIAELDRLLGGRLTRDDWLHTDHLKLIYPPGATLQDVP